MKNLKTVKFIVTAGLVLAFGFFATPAGAREVPFGPQSVISTAADYAYSVYAADVDGDGDFDVLSASSLDDKIAWYENDGASPPGWTERVISTAADGAHSVYAADVDGDGDMDVLSASVNDDKIAWYENDGASPPGWTTRTISTGANGAQSVYAADVDGDGDMDALSASYL
ncbi:MAG: VCBS repeat-containing protein, partial [Proteobacteria bacterium]|nr:VCBS repeat-containing protein [Pseudomonadota bacterium]